jgi:hypothetical protein
LHRYETLGKSTRPFRDLSQKRKQTRITIFKAALFVFCSQQQLSEVMAGIIEDLFKECTHYPFRTSQDLQKSALMKDGNPRYAVRFIAPGPVSPQINTEQRDGSFV